MNNRSPPPLGKIVPFLETAEKVIERDPLQLEAQDTLKYIQACTSLIHMLALQYFQPQILKPWETFLLKNAY